MYKAGITTVQQIIIYVIDNNEYYQKEQGLYEHLRYFMLIYIIKSYKNDKEDYNAQRQDIDLYQLLQKFIVHILLLSITGQVL